MGGMGPLFQLALFREYIEPLRPKKVVWVFYEGNDLDDLSYESQYDRLRAYLDPAYTQKLIHQQPVIDKILTKWLSQQKEAYRYS